MKLGIYADIPIDEYHAGDGVSNSGIAELLKSPLHYKKRAGYESTPAKILGSATHVAVLEPELFESMFAVWDGPSRASNAGKKAWAEWQLEHVGKQALTAKQLVKCKAMAAAVRASPEAKVLLAGGKREHSIYWIDKRTGVYCKARPDYLLPDGTVIEFKTAMDAGDEGFRKAAYNYSYHRQAAFYQEGVEQVLGTTGKPWIWLVVESEAPYAVAGYIMDAQQAELGLTEWTRGLDIYAECAANDKWPGYPVTLEPLGLPAWAARNLERGLDR